MGFFHTVCALPLDSLASHSICYQFVIGEFYYTDLHISNTLYCLAKSTEINLANYCLVYFFFFFHYLITINNAAFVEEITSGTLEHDITLWTSHNIIHFYFGPDFFWGCGLWICPALTLSLHTFQCGTYLYFEYFEHVLHHLSFRLPWLFRKQDF